MSATVRIHGQEATVDGYHWSSDNPTLARLLNAHMHHQGPSGADPDPDGTAADRAAQRHDGEVIQRDNPPAYDPDVIY